METRRLRRRAAPTNARKCGACGSDRDRRLSRLFPGARRLIAALGNVDQLDERMNMVGIDIRKTAIDFRVLRHLNCRARQAESSAGVPRTARIATACPAMAARGRS
jgi:hypothetical protein